MGGILDLTVSVSRIFRVLLAATLVSTGVGVWYAMARRAEFQTAFPGAESDTIYLALLAAGGAGIVSLAGLWFWRRWAAVLYAVVAVVSLGLDVAAEAPLVHQVTVLVGAVAILGLVYLNRSRFEGGL